MAEEENVQLPFPSWKQLFFRFFLCVLSGICIAYDQSIMMIIAAVLFPLQTVAFLIGRVIYIYWLADWLDNKIN